MGQNHADLASELVAIGNFGSPFGVSGWLRVNSYTDPKSNIWNFKEWFTSYKLGDLEFGNLTTDVVKVKRVKEYKHKFLVLLEGILDRCLASNLTNKKIFVAKKKFPSLAKDQYYWIDLVGAKVYNLTDQLLGVLDYLFHNGANDVMVIKDENREILIPHIKDFVVKVDLTKKVIIVNWDLSY